MRTRFWIFVTGIALVILFRVGVGIQQIFLKQEGASGLDLALGGLGLTFLICGVIAFWKNKGSAAFLFFLYCFGQAFHWGGPFEVANVRIQTVVWLVYFIISMFGISALLHFSMVYPEPWKFVRTKIGLPIIYAPPIIGLFLTLAGFVLPLEVSNQSFLNAFLLFEMVSVNLFALTTITIIVIRDIGADRETRRRFGLHLLVIGAILGPLPYIAAAVAGVSSTQPYNLFLALTPILFSYALVRSKA